MVQGWSSCGPGFALKMEEHGLSGILTVTKTTGPGKKVALLKVYVNREAWLVDGRWLEEGWAIWEVMSAEKGYKERFLSADAFQGFGRYCEEDEPLLHCGTDAAGPVLRAPHEEGSCRGEDARSRSWDAVDGAFGTGHVANMGSGSRSSGQGDEAVEEMVPISGLKAQEFCGEVHQEGG